MVVKKGGASGIPKQGILNVAIKDKVSLLSAYMPFVKSGGLFINTTKSYNLGDEIFLLLTLIDSPERIPVAGKVVWITPTGSQGSKKAGIGIQFNDGPDGDNARTKIETYVAGMSNDDKETLTM